MDAQEQPDRMLELIGVAALSLAIFSYSYSVLNSEYVATQGHIMGSSVTPAIDVSKPIRRRHAIVNPDDALKYTRVTYQYKVDGRQFYGCVDSETTSTSRPHRLAVAYHAGKSVPVYFNPERPHDSHIWKADSTNESFLIFLGIFSYLLAFLCRRFDSVSRYFGGADLPRSQVASEFPVVSDSHNPSFG